MGLMSLLFVMFSWADTYQLAKYDAQADSLDFARLQNVMNEASVTSPETFLIEWKKLKPEYFSNYVLGYRSRSLQKSSPTHPRALTFNKNADLVISFNGNPEHKGYKNLELMHFNHDTKSFEFFEMSFANRRAQLSEVNPKKCLACHQSSARTDVDPRPNWEPYNVWSGFYGSLDDNTELFKNGFEREPGFDPILDQVLVQEITSEAQWLLNFRALIQPTDARYSLLSTSTINEYGTRESTLNGDLTNRLAVLNFKRVARLIRTQPKEIYEFAKWAVWAHASCSMTLYMKEDVFEWLYAQAPNKDNARRKGRSSVSAPYPCRKRIEGINIDVDCTPPDYKDADSTDVINALFESVGVSTEDWSMDFKTDGARFAAFERFGVTNDPRPPWIEAIKHELNKDPELANADCAQAKKESIKRFSNLAEVQAKVAALRAQHPTPSAAPLISRCISCHSNTLISRDDAPSIPFDEPRQLKSYLNKEGYKRGSLLNEIRYRIGPHATEDEQMPKGGVPTSQQKEEFLKYLEGL